MLTGEAPSGPLSTKNYAALDALLGKTDMYSQFLMENLQSFQNSELADKPEVEADAEPEPEAPKGKAGTKRKAGKAAGKTVKKQKPLAATQVCCFTPILSSAAARQPVCQLVHAM